MRLIILKTGIPPEGLDKVHGTYPDMFRAMLAPLIPGLETVDIDVENGESLPSPDAADAFLITGSPAGAYEDHAWIGPLERFIREAVDVEKPLCGICFGHQIMAQALGGIVEKSSRGWGAGVHTYEVVEQAPFMDGATPPRVACAVSHQDQVITPPAGAVRLGGSPFCPYGILSYAGGRAISFQPHPEFTAEFAAALMSLRSDRIPDEVRALAMPSLAHPTDRGLIAQWIARFYLT